MSETETGEFLRDSTEPPNVMEIHCSTMPFGNQSIMTVTIPGHAPYRELYRTHPDNTLITAFTLLRRVANDYAALLVKCSTTHEAAETPRISPELVKLQNLLGDTQDERNKLRVELEATCSEILRKEALREEAESLASRNKALRQQLRERTFLLRKLLGYTLATLPKHKPWRDE